MEYKTSVPFAGSADAAIDIARSQFIVHGFKVNQSGPAEITVTGPGMQSTNQNPILGVTQAKISITSGHISVCAELGGVKFMQRFIYIFPPALCAFLGFTMAFFPNTPKHSPLIVIAVAAPWLVISPLMAKMIKTRTTKAVDTLVHNMKNISG